MFDRFGHGSITWDEIRILCGELAFSTLLPAMKDEAARARLYTKTSAGDESNGADGSGLTLNKLSRLLRSASVAQALEAESQHHTASYQYKVLEKCLQMLVSRHIDIYDISEARLAYNFHSHMFYGVSKSDKTAPPMSHLFCLLRRAMVPFQQKTLAAALRLASHAVAPSQLQAWMNEVRSKLVLQPIGEDGSQYVQFYEFLDLFVICEPVKHERARVVRPVNERQISVELDSSGQADDKPHSGTSEIGNDGAVRYEVSYEESEDLFVPYANGREKDGTGMYELAEEEFLLTPADRLWSRLDREYTNVVKEHKRQLLNESSLKEMQRRHQDEEKEKLRGSKVAAKEQLYREIKAAITDSSSTVTASRVVLRPADRNEAIERTQKLRQSFSRAGMPHVNYPSLGSVALSGSTRVQRSRKTGSIGLSTGRGSSGAPWGGVTESQNDLETIGIGETIDKRRVSTAGHANSKQLPLGDVSATNRRPVSRAQSAPSVPGFAPDLDEHSIASFEDSISPFHEEESSDCEYGSRQKTQRRPRTQRKQVSRSRSRPSLSLYEKQRATQRWVSSASDVGRKPAKKMTGRLDPRMSYPYFG